MLSRPTVVMLAVLVAIGIAIGVAWGGRALAVYAFLAGIAAAVSIGASVGGAWMRDTSAGRFERRRRR
jgi:hypothetical protein